MVRQTYCGLGAVEAAVRDFEAMAPHVVLMARLQARYAPFSPGHMALGIALDGLETAAYHFTRRRCFFEGIRRQAADDADHRLDDRRTATAVFEDLRPYVRSLRALQARCRPMGRDYLALEIAKHSLETAAYHFTGVAAFYGARSDASGAPLGAHGCG